MKALHRSIRRVFNFTTRRSGDERLREEIESHIAAQTEENIRAGMVPKEAARQARVKFGAVEMIREDYRAEEGLPLLEDLLLDIRYALRVLWKSPVFTVVALLTLTLGIGANVVVFGVLNAVLLHPLEMSDPHNLYQIRLKPWASGKALTTSYPAFEDYRQRNTTLKGLAGYNGFTGGTLRWGNTMKNVSGYAVTGNYFEFLGVQPQVGRLIQSADDRGPNSAPYLVLSDSLWRTAFDADPAVIGTNVRLGKNPFTVVGVAPARFHGTERFEWPDYWIPVVSFDAKQLQDRKGRPLTVLARLKQSVTPERAAEDLSAIAGHLAKEYPTTDTGVPLRLIRPGLQGDAGDVVRGFLYGVTGLALLVLVAACANLASLFAARAADRSRELALRVALGASRWRLVRQLITEAIVVSMLGGAAGLVAATLLLGALNRGQSPPPGQVAVSVDMGVYIAALLLSLVSGLLFGMIPARQVWQSSPLQAIKSGPVDPTPRRRLSLRDVLLGAQIAICTLLVTASFVAVRGMVRMLHAPLGFQPQGAMLAEMAVTEEGGVTVETKKKAMLEAVRSIPGVTAAAIVSKVPFTGGLRGIPIFPPGTTEFTLTNSVLDPYGLTISPAYFEAAGTRLLSGRDVSWHDTAQTPYVAVVNATFARKMWGDVPAIGQRFIVFDHLREVVGVVEDSKYNEIGESPPPAFYLPFSQHEQANTTFVVRAQNETAAALERTLSGFDPDASTITVQSWRDAMGYALFPSRAAATGLGVMGLLAAMLAVTGIFGMAAYNVSRRMKEIGIRMALGARTRHVMSTAVGRPLVLLGIGSFAGLLLCVFASRLLGQIVYQGNSRDPVVVLGAVLTMALLGLAASAIPALRALAVDPSKLMREE